MRYLSLSIVVVLAFGLSGCFNLGTKPSEITPAFVPVSQFQRESCQQLDVDRASLYRRESMLTTAQEQRRHSNKVQAFWVGFGNGDGVGAGELAQVKGEILALEKARAMKRCGREAGSAPVAAASADSPGAWPLQLPSFDIRAGCQSGGGDVARCISAERNARAWLAGHSTTVQIAGDCSTFAQQQQSYTLIAACVRQHERQPH